MIQVELDKSVSRDFEELGEDVKEEIKTKLTKLEKEGISIAEVSPWEDNNGDLLFRLKIKEKNTDHRAFFDIENGKAVIYGIFHRDEAYENSVKKELNSRIN